jgi:flagellar hook assembly protein FlgD
VAASVTPTPAYLAQAFIESLSGHRVKALAPLGVHAYGQGLQLSTGVLQVDGVQVVSIRDADGNLLGEWNGLHADGGFATPGAYRIRVVWSEGGAELAQASIGLAVQPAGNALIRSVRVAPNPAGKDASGRVSLRWVPDARTATVRGRFYSLAGELISQDEAAATAGRLDWDLRAGSGRSVSGGIYLWQVEALSGEGLILERKVLKFVVIR